MTYRYLLSCIGLVLCLMPLVYVPWAHSEEFDCLIEPYVTVKVSSAVPGLLETVTVDRGDFVKKGQTLATLESGAEKAAIEVLRARATMESAIKTGQARLEWSTRSYSRNQGMFQKALIAVEKMDEIETAKRLAEMTLVEATDNRRLAELELRQATAELARRTLHSPITGVVVERLLASGEFAHEEQPVLKLAQLDPLRVEVFVPVALLGSITVGQQVEVALQAPINGTYLARVTVVDRVVDAASGLFGVRLELPNGDYRLPAGLKCKLRLP
jgi:membrane fusion protein (multidrug efflux system)